MSASRRNGNLGRVAGRMGATLAVVFATALLEGAALAADSDVLNVVVGASITHDSNIFKRPDSLGIQSDMITQANVGLRVDKPYAQQRFQFEITQTTSRYDKLSRLNFDAIDYTGSWLWHLTPRWSGTLSASRTESLVPFEDTLGNQRNARTSERRGLNADGLLFGGWHVLLGVTQSDQKSEQSVQIEPDFRSVSAEVGVRYVAPSGNSISATQRRTEGDYLNKSVVTGLADRSFEDNESELRAIWAVTGKSSFTGRVAWINRVQESAPGFSGYATDLSYGWKPTGKLSLDVTAKRRLTPLQNSPSAYVVNDSFSIGPTWQASAKIAVRLRLAHTQSDYKGTGVVAPTGPEREDRLNSAEIGMDWAIVRNGTIGVSIRQQRRTSNTPGLDFDATVASINASAAF